MALQILLSFYFSANEHFPMLNRILLQNNFYVALVYSEA